MIPCWIVLFDASRRIGAEGFGGAAVGSLFALGVGAIALIGFGCRTVAAGMMIGPIVSKGLSPCRIVLFHASRRSFFPLGVGAIALIDFGCRTVAAGMKIPYFALG